MHSLSESGLLEVDDHLPIQHGSAVFVCSQVNGCCTCQLHGAVSFLINSPTYHIPTTIQGDEFTMCLNKRTTPCSTGMFRVCSTANDGHRHQVISGYRCHLGVTHHPRLDEDVEDVVQHR
jgi:hypothetical protein